MPITKKNYMQIVFNKLIVFVPKEKHKRDSKLLKLP